jgi:hypothetical protein
MQLNLSLKKNMVKCFMIFAITYFPSYSLALDYRPPVKNPYMEKFHWSLPADIRAMVALDSASEEKLHTCVGQSNDVGSGAEGLYDEHFRKGDSMELLAKDLPRQERVEGYKPEPKRALEPWAKGDSTENISKMLVKRTLDLMWGYYKDYEKPAATTDKTSVAQQVMWDYCLTIPKELFVE